VLLLTNLPNDVPFENDWHVVDWILQDVGH
jgi:hypothetical protein